VMAVFGVPVSHEDDALRAVRAAWEMRDAIARLGLEARIGVNTGEVVAGDGDSLVTGDDVLDVSLLALNRGRIALAQGELAEAQRQISAAAQYGARIDDWEFASYLAPAEGDLARTLGDVDRARAAYERARKVAAAKGIAPLVATAEARLAQLDSKP
jgi:hypothetical protein